MVCVAGGHKCITEEYGGDVKQKKSDRLTIRRLHNNMWLSGALETPSMKAQQTHAAVCAASALLTHPCETGITVLQC